MYQTLDNEEIERMLNSEDWRVRCDAAEKINSSTPLELVKKMLTDPNPIVRKIALEMYQYRHVPRHVSFDKNN